MLNLTVAGWTGNGSTAAWLASRSSSCSSSCSISWSNFSERGPNCMRLSLRMSSFRFSISVLRASSSDCLASTSAFNAGMSSELRSSCWFSRLLTASIGTLCHARKKRCKHFFTYMLFYTASAGVEVRNGLRQSMPSRSIESCARLNDTAPCSA